MCIFTQPAHVSKTKIYVARAKDPKRQITIYQNAVMTENKGNAMILPALGKIEMYDMSAYPGDFFKDCEDCFPPPKSYNFGGGFGAFLSKEEPDLPVFRVGAYRVSIAPDLASLTRLDKTVFTVSP